MRAKKRRRGSTVEQHQLGKLGFACLIVLVAYIINQKGVGQLLVQSENTPPPFPFDTLLL